MQLARKPETAAEKQAAAASGGEGVSGGEGRRRNSGRGRGRGRARGGRTSRGGRSVSCRTYQNLNTMMLTPANFFSAKQMLWKIRTSRVRPYH